MIKRLIRLYLMAHAPADPQPWFKPTVETPSPGLAPSRPSDLTNEERNELEGWGDYYDTEDLTNPRARAYAVAKDAHSKAMKAYNAEVIKAGYVQWPAAWADAVMGASK
jgi:hypothetical protein